MSAMPLSKEEVEQLARELDELTDQAAATDKRIEEAKEDAAEARESLTRIQRRLTESAKSS